MSLKAALGHVPDSLKQLLDAASLGAVVSGLLSSMPLLVAAATLAWTVLRAVLAAIELHDRLKYGPKQNQGETK